MQQTTISLLTSNIETTSLTYMDHTGTNPKFTHFNFLNPKVMANCADKLSMETQPTKTKETKSAGVLVVRHDVNATSIAALLALGYSLVVLNKGE